MCENSRMNESMLDAVEGLFHLITDDNIFDRNCSLSYLLISLLPFSLVVNFILHKIMILTFQLVQSSS